MDLRRRLLTWTAGLLLYTVLMVPVGTALVVLVWFPPWGDDGAFLWVRRSADVLSEARWWAYAFPACALIALTQYLFLLPVVHLRPPQGTRSRSLTRSLILGALLAALITGALGLGVVELAGSILHGNFQEDPWGDELLSEIWIWPALFVLLAGSWIFWTMLLLIFSRRLWADTVLGRFTVLLLGGTIVELLVVLPIDVMVRRRTNCYCTTGTFWSLSVSAVGLLWLAGPGIVFALTARRRRTARETHCGRCGQAKGPSPGGVCPECGYKWVARVAGSTAR